MDYQQRKQHQQSATEFAHTSSEIGMQHDPLSEVNRDLEGWREILVTLAGVLRWDKPFYPAITAGVVAVLFLLIWLSGLSTVTTVSLIMLILGVLDFAAPFVGPKVTGLQTWTGNEESEFNEICSSVLNFQRDIADTWLGLSAMRQQNPRMFFFITVGFLSCTAWIGNLIDNLLLTYLFVTLILMVPGMQQHGIGKKFIYTVKNLLLKLRQGAQEKEKSN